MENNESQMMGIKKKEYLRVLSNIVKESQHAQVRRCLSVYCAHLNGCLSIPANAVPETACVISWTCVELKRQATSVRVLSNVVDRGRRRSP